MGIAKYVRKTWKKPKAGMPMLHRRDRMASWRKDPVFQRVHRPTRIDAARRLGYKACLLYTSPSPRDKRQSRMPSSA